MSAPPPSQLKNRIVTMCGRITNITTSQDGWPEDEHGFNASELAAILTQIRLPVLMQPVSGTQFSLTTTFELLLLAARFPADRRLRDVETWEACEPFVLSIPSYFNQHRRLEDSDAGLAVSITLPQLQAIEALALDNALYAAARFTMQVQTLHT